MIIKRVGLACLGVALIAVAVWLLYEGSRAGAGGVFFIFVPVFVFGVGFVLKACIKQEV